MERLSRPYYQISKHAHHLVSSTLLKVLHGETNKPKKKETRYHCYGNPKNDQRITPSMLLRILDISPPSNHSHLLHFLFISYMKTYGGSRDDATLSFIIDHFLRRRNYSPIHRLLFPNKFTTMRLHGNHEIPPAPDLIKRLVRAGQPKDAIAAFNALTFYSKFDEITADVAIKLWRTGYTGNAGSMIRGFGYRATPITMIVETLGPAAAVPLFSYKLRNILGRATAADADDRSYDIRWRDCTWIDPREIEKVLIEMEAHGVPLNVNTFNILIYYLATVTRADDARLLFQSMERKGFTPNSRTYVLMARAFYKERRVDEGDEMVMKARTTSHPLGCGDYHGFIKILCKAGLVEHAVRVFEMMSRDGFFLKAKAYNMVIENLSLRNRGDVLNTVFAIAKKGRLPMKEMSVYLSDGTVLKGLSEDARAKYWELCAACGKILHLGVNGQCCSVVMTAYINVLTEVFSDVQSVEGDDATPPSSSVVEAWLRGLRVLERAGMDVSFLRERIECLKALSVPSGDVEHPET